MLLRIVGIVCPTIESSTIYSEMHWFVSLGAKLLSIDG